MRIESGEFVLAEMRPGFDRYMMATTTRRAHQRYRAIDCFPLMPGKLDTDKSIVGRHRRKDAETTASCFREAIDAGAADAFARRGQPALDREIGAHGQRTALG